MINIETAREIKKYALKYNVSFDILLKSLDLNSFDENMIKDIADKLNIEKVQLFTFEMWKYDSPNDEFRGWVLPNGKMINRFFDRSGEPKTVQDHGKLFQIFLLGLEEYDKTYYDKMINEINIYSEENYNALDPYESFAVERLGWLQVGIFGRKMIICRGERFQDKYLDKFINEKKVHVMYHNKGPCIGHIFNDLYDNMEVIMELGLKKKYNTLYNEQKVNSYL